MRRWTVMLAVCAGVVALSLVGCTENGEAESEATAIATTTPAVDTTVVALVQTTTTVVAATSTTEPMDPDAACVDCHMDQEALLALAVEPVDSESLSSGEG